MSGREGCVSGSEGVSRRVQVYLRWLWEPGEVNGWMGGCVPLMVRANSAVLGL